MRSMRQTEGHRPGTTEPSASEAAGGADRGARATATERATDEWDALATALNAWGIKHVAPARPYRGDIPRTPRELFERLARTGDPRLQEASTMLLLTHPNLAPEARAAISALDRASRDRAMRRYVAAAAMQRMARTRIALHLGQQPDVSPAYLDELGLPGLEEDYGRETLLALAADEEQRYGNPAWRGYLTLLDRFLAEIRRRGWGKSCGSASTGRG